MGSTISADLYHTQLCENYLDSLSLYEQKLVKEYTNESYQTINKYLVSKTNICMMNEFDDTTADFDLKTTEDCLVLYRILINAPRIQQDVKLYHFFSNKRIVKVNTINSGEPLKIKYKNNLKIGDKYIEPKFTSTTYDPDVLKYISGFSNYEGSCCYIEFIVPKGFPLLFIPSKYSYYPYQKEVLLPYGILFSVVNIQPKTLKLYHPTEDVTDIVNNDDIRINVKIKDRATLKEKTMMMTQSRLDVKIISKEKIEFMNRILYDLYYIYCPNAHDYTHITRVILASLVFLKIYEEVTSKKYSGEIYPIMYTGLFHDAGRRGRDGEDIWEKKSASIARKELMKTNISTSVIDSISEAIYNADSTSIPHMVFKGADSLDIIRVNSYYDKNKNPFYKFIKKNEPSSLLQVENLMSKLELEQYILIEVSMYIQSAYNTSCREINDDYDEEYDEDEQDDNELNENYKEDIFNKRIKKLLSMLKKNVLDDIDSNFDVCDKEYEEPEDKDELRTDALEEQVFEDYPDRTEEEDEEKKIKQTLLQNVSKEKLNMRIEAKRRITMKYNNEYVNSIAKYAIQKNFFSEERKNYIFSDTVVLIRLLSDVLPVYKQYLSSFVFQV